MSVLPADETRANFTLYVTNQSFQNGRIQIRVTIDTQEVASGDFEVGNQHNFSRYFLRVGSGLRKVSAQAADGSRIDAVFEMPGDGQRWGFLSYRAAPETAPGLSWQFLAERPLLG